jgi:hypothetical protein
MIERALLGTVLAVREYTMVRPVRQKPESEAKLQPYLRNITD